MEENLHQEWFKACLDNSSGSDSPKSNPNAYGSDQHQSGRAKGSRLLGLVNGPVDGQKECAITIGKAQSDDNCLREQDLNVDNKLSSDEAQLLAQFRQCIDHRNRKNSGENQPPTKSLGATSSFATSQNTAIDSNFQEEMSYLSLQQHEQPTLDVYGQDWSYTSPMIKQQFGETATGQPDHVDPIFNVFATPNKFEAIQFNEHNQNTAASSTPQTANDQMHLSGPNPKNLLSESVVPNSDDREMSLLVDNLLIEEDVQVSQPTVEDLSVQAISIPREVPIESDKKRECSQFLIGMNLEILNQEAMATESDDQKHLECDEFVSDFKTQTEISNHEQEQTLMPMTRELSQAFNMNVNDMQPQMVAADEINRVKIEPQAVMTAFKLIDECETEKENSNTKEEFDFPDGGWVCSSCQNYNFFGRQKCNRCQKQKSRQDRNGKPNHLLRNQANKSSSTALFTQKKPADIKFELTSKAQQKKEKQKANENAAQKKTQSAKQTAAPAASLSAAQQALANKTGERIGDWVCVACTNLNFAFRQMCNRCWRDRNDTQTVILEDQSELQKFQTAGCTTQYLQNTLGPNVNKARRQAQTIQRPEVTSQVFGGLNSDAACFKPGSFVQAQKDTCFEKIEHQIKKDPK